MSVPSVVASKKVVVSVLTGAAGCAGAVAFNSHRTSNTQTYRIKTDLSNSMVGDAGMRSTSPYGPYGGVRRNRQSTSWVNDIPVSYVPR